MIKSFAFYHHPEKTRLLRLLDCASHCDFRLHCCHLKSSFGVDLHYLMLFHRCCACLLCQARAVRCQPFHWIHIRSSKVKVGKKVKGFLISCVIVAKFDY